MLVYCTSENITAQRLAEANEKASEQRRLASADFLNLVLANLDSAVAVIVFEKDGARLHFANSRYYEMLGCTKAQYESEQPELLSFIHPEDRALWGRLAAKANADGQPYALHCRIITKAGEVRSVKCRVSCMNIAGKEQHVQMAVVSDITPLVEAEQRNAMLEEQLRKA